MNFYELLLNRGQPSGEGMTHFERLFAAKLAGGGGEIKELEGVPPLLFKANGEPLIDWSIYGNMQQTGTPTSASPIYPSETGERTANLFNVNRQESTTFTTDEKYYIKGGVGNSTSVSPTVITATVSNNTLSVTASGTGNGVGYIIDVNPNTTYTISFDTDITVDNKTYAVANTITENLQMGTMISLYSKTQTITTSADTKYLYIVFRVVNNTCVYSNIMVNEGSTALPYEPYSYKIPISSANTTTPVYLGEVESTRRIKKLALTGEEERWSKHATITSWFMLNINTLETNTIVSNVEICSHYKPSTGTPASIANGEILVNYQDGNKRIIIRDTSYSLLDDFKAFLQQQYANGTPVTVWYVLATEETAVVNEQLMKIGEYADSLTATQAGVEIPTIKGNNTLDIDTTLKPSNVYIKYKD